MFLISKEKKERKNNLKKWWKYYWYKKNIYDSVNGRVLYIGKSIDVEGNIFKSGAESGDITSIYFISTKGIYFRGIISYDMIQILPFKLNHGQYYKFNTREPLIKREQYTLMRVSEITSIE